MRPVDALWESVWKGCGALSEVAIIAALPHVFWAKRISSSISILAHVANDDRGGSSTWVRIPVTGRRVCAQPLKSASSSPFTLLNHRRTVRPIPGSLPNSEKVPARLERGEIQPHRQQGNAIFNLRFASHGNQRPIRAFPQLGFVRTGLAADRQPDRQRLRLPSQEDWLLI